MERLNLEFHSTKGRKTRVSIWKRPAPKAKINDFFEKSFSRKKLKRKKVLTKKAKGLKAEMKCKKTRAEKREGENATRIFNKKTLRRKTPGEKMA